MKKAFIWLAGSGLLCWLCWHFQVWHMLLQLTLVSVTFVWLFVGAWIASRRPRERPSPKPEFNAHLLQEQIAAERRAWVARFGEDSAKQQEAIDGQMWVKLAWKTIGRP